MREPLVKYKHDWITTQTLTGSYAAGETASGFIQLDGYNQLTLVVNYIPGATETNNTLYIKIEVSVDADRTLLGQLTTEAAAAGVVTISAREYTILGAVASTTYGRAIEIPINARFAKISVWESGKVTNFGTVSMDYMLSSHV